MENSFGINREIKMPKTAKIPPERAPEANHFSFEALIQRKPPRKEHKYKITADAGKIIAFGSGNERRIALAIMHITRDTARAIRELFSDEIIIPELPLRCFCLLILSDIVFFLSIDLR